MDVLLIAGLWLPKSMWSEVASELDKLGYHAIPVSLPGADDGSTTATLADQLDAVLAATDAADRPVIVGHSAACTLAWMVADRRPSDIDRLVLVGGVPSGSGEAYADFLPIVDGVMPFPGWEPFAGPDSDDLDATQRDFIASNAVPVPAGVAQALVTLHDERRYEVPTVLVCPEYSVEQAQGWIGDGDVPELSAAKNVAFVDIASGHWPMVSQPVEFARVIDAAIRGETVTG